MSDTNSSSCSLSETSNFALTSTPPLHFSLFCNVCIFHSTEQAAFEIKVSDAAWLSGSTESEEVIEKTMSGESYNALIIFVAENNICGWTNDSFGNRTVDMDFSHLSLHCTSLSYKEHKVYATSISSFCP